MDTLKENLKKQVIEQLNIQDTAPADIDDNKPLFDSSGLGLDSIDALEMIVMFERYYGIAVLDLEDSKKAFHSISTMAAYIREKKLGIKSNGLAED